MNKAIRLASEHDFTILSETHGVSGKEDALKLPGHLTAFWSHGTASIAGVGLIVHNDFLKQFDKVDPNRDWIRIVPGNVARLRLRGPSGALDLFCVYFPTGDATYSEERKQAVLEISNNVFPKEEVLSLMAGDFNFVENVHDRLCTSSGELTGNKDSTEADFFKNHLREEHSFQEWEQSHFTYEVDNARSRIDRMYSNQHVAYQLDRHISCTTLEWDKQLSTHRPISFSRRTPRPKNQENKPIPLNEFKREGWKDQVIEHFKYLCRGDPCINNPVRHLILLKDAIRNVYDMNRGDFNKVDLGSSPDDKLGFTLCCLKAVETKRWHLVHRCVRAYPKLSEWIKEDQYEVSNSCLSNMRDHALELAREQIQLEIHSLNAGSLDADDKAKVKESVLRKLKRMAPGTCQGIGAMLKEDGSLASSPDEIVKILRAHWGGVFKRREVRHMGVQIWMEELFIKDDEGCFITGLPARGDRAWNIPRKAIKTALYSSKNSMPGPDGIPVAAFKALGEVAVDVLHGVTNSLQSAGHKDLLVEAYRDRCTEDRHDFNLSLLCCLPKKPCGADPEQGEFYRGEDTRPLALVNTDNRIIASAARIAWEPLLSKYISTAQQGFLKGRQMINNIIEVDYDSMTVSLKCERGMLVLFDFKAAFPSVAHKYLRTSLAAVGLPEHALHFIDALYDNNRCNISFQGNIYEGFDMQCGVRQGCPISPLLFAASVDVLLRILKSRIPGGTFKAFADDIGAVLPNWEVDSAVAESIFGEFAEMSGLDLNIEKTVGIPLWDSNIEDIRQTLRRSERRWNGMCVASEGTYLGFVLGPGRGRKAWEKPTKKYSQRCDCWGGMGTGLMFSTIAYNTFASSTLGYISQLVEPDEQVFAAEAEGLRRMLPGPGNWVHTEDAFHLRESFGQLHSFRSVRATAAAAKLRVKYNHDSQRRREGANSYTLSIANMAERIKTLHQRNDFPYRAALWNAWYCSSFACVLQDNEASLGDSFGIHIEGILQEIAGSPRPWSAEVRAKQKKSLQRAVTCHILKATRPNAVNRIRENIERWAECKGNCVGWGIPGPLGKVAPRICRNLQRLHLLVPPRVCAAVFRTIFNGWVTHRRYQRRSAPSNLCMLGCSGHSEDSIEHYCRCPAVLKILERRLRIIVSPAQALAFWMMACPSSNDDILMCSALSTYAGYMAFNKYRKIGRPQNIERAIDAMGQYLIQSAYGHPNVGRFLDNRWTSPMLYLN